MKTLWRIIVSAAVFAFGLLAVFKRGERAGEAEQAAKTASDKANAAHEGVKFMTDTEVAKKAKKWVRRG